SRRDRARQSLRLIAGAMRNEQWAAFVHQTQHACTVVVVQTAQVSVRIDRRLVRSAERTPSTFWRIGDKQDDPDPQSAKSWATTRDPSAPRLVAVIPASSNRSSSQEGSTPMSQPASITTALTLSLVVPGDEPLPVDAALEYDPADPFAVHLVIAAGEGLVRWSFSRELLTEGVKASAGSGDVRIIPFAGKLERRVRVVLTSPDGAATLEAPLTEMVEFLTASYAAVPSGSEADLLDMD